MVQAVIDIGTNTVKLLVADVEEGRIAPVVSRDRMTRLGEGVQESGRLSVAAIDRTAQAVAGFLAEARTLGATEVVAITTSAAREAVNGAEFAAAIQARCGLAVAVLSGEREAELIFRGVTSDPAFATARLLVMDVGGGSAEFILGQTGTIERWQSLPLGAVRLTEQFRDREFADLAEFIRRALHAALTGYQTGSWRLVATGGASTTMARIATGHADHGRLTQEEVRALVANLNRLSLAERRQVPGLPPDRADIIVAGGAVVMFAMELLGAGELTVSTRNLRYGVLAGD